MPHRRATTAKGLVIVANRLPVELGSDGQVGASPGGLVSALASIADEETHWVGWGGVGSERAGAFDHSRLHLHPVSLTREDVDGHYRGFSSSVLWPLFHGRLRRVELDRTWWQSYRAVNERFAETVAGVAPLGASVWLHDYHLLIAPAMLAAVRPDLRIGLFLHVPFPSACMFSMLPWRREIIEGMLGADVIGFQVPQDVTNFVAAATRVSCADVRGSTVRHDSHTVEVGAFPISVDFGVWDSLGAQASAEAARHRRELGVDTILLGIDRLDYTKGISHRLQAFGELLDEGRLDAASCTFVQVAVPTRSELPAYQDERAEVEALIGTINTRHRRTNGTAPVVYIDSSLDAAEVAGWYRTADVLVVTSLADGMNLVVKEFVAARDDCSASVILSEFAGASHGLEGALVVNPYDIDAIKRAIVSSIDMPESTKRAGLRAMRDVVRNNDVHHWARQFLGRLHAVEHPRLGASDVSADPHGSIELEASSGRA